MKARRCNRTGKPFEGRYKAGHATMDHHLIHICRSTHAKPVTCCLGVCP